MWGRGEAPADTQAVLYYTASVSHYQPTRCSAASALTSQPYGASWQSFEIAIIADPEDCAWISEIKGNWGGWVHLYRVGSQWHTDIELLGCITVVEF
jgi:hypothetical protein